MKFICSGYFDETAWNAMPEAEQQTFMDKCLAFDAELRRNGNWLGGEALQSVRHAVTIRLKNGVATTTDGPFSETKEQIGGLLYLEARDLNHAIALMSKHPGLRAGPFEIRGVDEEFTRMIVAKSAELAKN